MNNEEKFKEALQDKLASKEFPFAEKDWFAMSDMIDRSRERKLRGAWLFVLCLVCGLGSLGLYMFTSGKKQTLMAAEHPNEKTDVTANLPESTGPVTTAAVMEPVTPKKQKARVPKATTPATVKNAQSEQPSVTPEVVKPSAKVSMARPAETTTRLETKNIPVKNRKTETLPVKTEPVVTLPAAAVMAPDNTKDQPSENSNATTPVVMTPDVKEEIVVTQKIQEPAVSIVVPEKETEPAVITPTETVVVGAKDTIKPSVAAAEIILPAPDFIRHTVSLEAGANYLTGWKTNDVKDGNGFNFTGGINYAYSVTRRLALSTGLHYSAVGHLKAYSHSSKTTAYSFGEQTDITVITPEKMNYLQVPLKFNYMPNSKNVFGAGYTFGYLLSVKSNMQTSAQGYNYTGSNSTSVTRGYTEGFNSFDSQVSVFYRRRILSDWWINAEFLVGVMDSRKNSFFKTPVAERNSGIKLTVVYSIFQK